MDGILRRPARRSRHIVRGNESLPPLDINASGYGAGGWDLTIAARLRATSSVTSSCATPPRRNNVPRRTSTTLRPSCLATSIARSRTSVPAM